MLRILLAVLVVLFVGGCGVNGAEQQQVGGATKPQAGVEKPTPKPEEPVAKPPKPEEPVAKPPKPEEPVAKPPDPQAALKAALKQAVEQMRRELPAEFIVEPVADIFVVAGNMDRGSFDTYKQATVQRAAEALWNDFFTKARPSKPIKIYLLRDKASYAKWTKILSGHEPPSPYGFFMPYENTMVMNIATGGGTLVHEMTHALMFPDFPNCPTWLLEGLGSLFEQCQTIAGGHILGKVNWRLPGLLAGGFVPLQKLVGMPDAEFRGPRVGLNYANARYLCFYLQERGLLQEFYKTFRDAHAEGKDKTGWETFKQVIKQPPGEFEKAWHAWVKTLKWPPGR